MTLRIVRLGQSCGGCAGERRPRRAGARCVPDVLVVVDIAVSVEAESKHLLSGTHLEMKHCGAPHMWCLGRV